MEVMAYFAKILHAVNVNDAMLADLGMVNVKRQVEEIDRSMNIRQS